VGQFESPSGTELSPCLRVANLQKIFFIYSRYDNKKILDIRIAHTLYAHQSDPNLTSTPPHPFILSLPPSLHPYPPHGEGGGNVGGRRL
jgi:hypothetical protein